MPQRLHQVYKPPMVAQNRARIVLVITHRCLSIFPMMLGLVPPGSPNLGALLDLIRDENHLCTVCPFLLQLISVCNMHLPPFRVRLRCSLPFQVRSLLWPGRELLERWGALRSRTVLRIWVSESERGGDLPTTAGPIWINMNYLILSSLHNYYASRPGPYQERAKAIYEELRAQIIGNMYKVCSR